MIQALAGFFYISVWCEKIQAPCQSLFARHGALVDPIMVQKIFSMSHSSAPVKAGFPGKNVYLFLLFILPLSPAFLAAQSQAVYFTEKPGTYTFHNNIHSRGTEYVAFGNNVKTLSDYFKHTIPVMKANKGFDLEVILFGIHDDEYTKLSCNYGVRGELRFDFQLFLKEEGKEGKWTVEPPHWEFYINNTESGHGAPFEIGKMKGLFAVFPLMKEIAPGVRLYGDGNLIVYNPARPDFWIPLTVREVVNAKLAFYKADESNRTLYDYIKPMVATMSREELDAPAYYGSDDGILNVNGRQLGLQIMRFNPNYWDRSLPPSAIQFMTFNYTPESEFDMAEYITIHGHPKYAQLISNSLRLKYLPQLLNKRNN